MRIPLWKDEGKRVRPRHCLEKGSAKDTADEKTVVPYEQRILSKAIRNKINSPIKGGQTPDRHIATGE